MKAIISPLLFIMLISFFSCTSDNFTSGVKGHIEFTAVDCTLNQTFWEYDNYNGMVYVVPKDSVNGTFGNYIPMDSVQAINGDFSIGLNPGYYYIFIEEYQTFNINNEIVVNLNQVTQKDFRFHKCI